MVELIAKKREGKELTKAELKQIVDGYVGGSIPDYQMSAFLMALYFKGMKPKETAIFTELMMHSGEVINLSSIKGVKVDKHSTGGVGDKTTLILAPLVAAAGVPVAKMSGRGLGHTGGTIDKLEAIKGFSVDMSRKKFIALLKKIGIAVCGQNEKLVPADKKIYALRDVTGTVRENSLIASSIMSKKLACGADAIVIDIKVGDGAFMKNLKEATQLGRAMQSIGKQMGRKVIGVATSMDQPLGRAVGNAIEVKEAIETLKGNGPDDLTELCYQLGAQMLIVAKKTKSIDKAKAILKDLIDSGKAFDKFKEFVKEQGGNVKMVEKPSKLPVSKHSVDVLSPKSGYVTDLKAFDVGLTSVKLGAGRETKTSKIDPGAGIYLHKKIGEKVKKGEALATMYTQNKKSIKKAKEILLNAYTIKRTKPRKKKLILKIID